MHHETALDWFQRSNSSNSKSGRRRRPHHPPQSPLEAAHHFCRGNSGLSYIDHVWQSSSSSSSVVVALEGKSSHSRAAVTWTLRSLVAKFVVATRASAFAADSGDVSQQSQQPQSPQVLILDTKGDFVGPTACRALHHVLASTLKKKKTQEGHPNKNINISHDDDDEDLQECTRRISIINASQYAPVALLEVLAQQQQQQQQTSASTALLIVWNGLNDGTSAMHHHHHDTTTNHHSNLLLCQQWARAVVAASKHDNYQHHWQWVVATEKVVGPLLQSALHAKTKTMGVQRVLLEPRQQQGKDCVATALGKQFSFSLSLEGILS